MRRLHRAVFLVVTAALVCECPASRVQACAPFIHQSVFWWRQMPDIDASSFARGELGIVSPRFSRSYLIVAYRTLSDRTLTDAEAESVKHMWDVRLRLAPDGSGVADQWQERWEKARARVPGVDAAPDVAAYRRTNAGFAYSRNILADGFKVAADTLRDRDRRYGPRSPALVAWVRAQDLVFSGATAADVEKVAVPAAAPAVARADREYQVAAAAFYSGEYADARRRFLAIAADVNSPWRPFGTYLAARSALREGGAALAESQRLFEAVVADPSLAKLHQTSRGLLLRIRAPQEPKEQFRPWLAGAILAERPGPLFGDLVRHLALAVDAAPRSARQTSGDGDSRAPAFFPGEDPRHDPDDFDERWRFAESASLRAEHDLIDWMLTLQSTDAAAAAHAMDRWRRTRRTVWLVAAMSGLRSMRGAAALEAMQAAAAVPPASPAYATVAFHRARLLIDAGRAPDARSVLDAALVVQRLPLTARNRLRDLRLRTVATLDDLVADIGVGAAGLRAPGYPEYVFSATAPTCGSDFDQTGCDDLRAIASRPQVLPRAAALIDGLPLPMLAKLADDDRVPDPVRREIAQAAFVRALVVGDDDATRAWAARLSKQRSTDNASLASEFARVSAAATPADRRFESAWILVRYPVLSPFVRAGLARLTAASSIDNYRDNWWDRPILDQRRRDPDEEGPALAPAPFLDAESRRLVEAEHRRLREAGTAGAFMARAVVEGAAGRGADTRLPEALYRAVRATRLAGGGEWSRRAFVLLHKQFPNSTWAKRTTVWY